MCVCESRIQFATLTDINENIAASPWCNFAFNCWLIDFTLIVFCFKPTYSLWTFHFYFKGHSVFIWFYFSLYLMYCLSCRRIYIYVCVCVCVCMCVCVCVLLLLLLGRSLSFKHAWLNNKDTFFPSTNNSWWWWWWPMKSPKPLWSISVNWSTKSNQIVSGDSTVLWHLVGTEFL